MKIATGKVVGGKVVVDGGPLEEGASVTVLARDGENGFTLSPRRRLGSCCLSPRPIVVRRSLPKRCLRSLPAVAAE